MTEITEIEFYGDTLYAVDHEGRPLVALRRVSDNLGLKWSGQLAKLSAAQWACVQNIRSQLPGDTQSREHLFGDMRTVLMWLATINPSKTASHVRDKLVAYQSEVADVIEAYFTKGAVVNYRLDLDDPDAMLNVLDDAVQAARREREARIEAELQRDALVTPAKVRDAIYDHHDGYTRNNLWKIAKAEVGFPGGHVEFNELLRVLGITVKGGGNFHITPEYYWTSNDATYSWMGDERPNNNPHFNEEGKDYIINKVSELMERRKAS